METLKLAEINEKKKIYRRGVVFDKETYDIIKNIAEKEMRSMSNLIRVAINEYIKNHYKEKKENGN